VLRSTAGRRIQTNCCTASGGNAVAGLYGLGLSARRQKREGNGARLNQSFGEHSISGVTDKAGFPEGYRHPGWWVPPMKAGALASYSEIEGDGTLVGSGAMGVNAEASLSGAGDLAGVAQLIISMVASLTGSGTISNADLLAYLQLSASLAGSGDLEGAIGAIAWAEANVSGEGDLQATVTALGELLASITVSGDLLSTTNVAGAVWGAIAAANNNAGTMGEKLNDAGSASNPWTEVIESGFTAAEILRLIAAVVQGDATGLTTSPDFKGLDGTTTRVAGTVSGGNRTISTRNGA
jgi:hypothetical protein